MPVAAAADTGVGLARALAVGTGRVDRQRTGLDGLGQTRAGRKAERRPGRRERRVARQRRPRVDRDVGDALGAELHDVAVCDAHEDERAVDADALVVLRIFEKPARVAVPERDRAFLVQAQVQAVRAEQVGDLADEAQPLGGDAVAIERAGLGDAECSRRQRVAAARNQGDAAALDQVRAIAARIPAHLPVAAVALRERRQPRLQLRVARGIEAERRRDVQRAVAGLMRRHAVGGVGGRIGLGGFVRLDRRDGQHDERQQRGDRGLGYAEHRRSSPGVGSLAASVPRAGRLQSPRTLRSDRSIMDQPGLPYALRPIPGAATPGRAGQMVPAGVAAA